MLKRLLKGLLYTKYSFHLKTVLRGVVIMTITIKTKNLEFGKQTKVKIENKIKKIEKLFSKDASAIVRVSQEKPGYKVEITAPIANRTVRAEVSGDDMMAAIEKCVDLVENQIIRLKGRMQSKARRNTAYVSEYEAIPVEEEYVADETEILIEKTKTFELRPMDAEEAVMQMELIGHEFFVFLNVANEKICVVYKRKNGTYGLIEPEN